MTNADGSGKRRLAAGDLLVLPQGWTGEWEIHEHVRKLFIIEAGRPHGEFDFIGAGSAGSVLANRLSENGRFSVLLPEAAARIVPSG